MAAKTAPPEMSREQIDAIDHELRMLDLEEKRESAAQRRANKDQRLRRREDVEGALRRAAAEQKMREEECPHLKGGTDVEGVFVGNSPNYAVIKHTDNLGHTMVICQRCGTVKHRPEQAAYASVSDYADALREYRRWLAFPTDNKPSGTQMFSVEREVA